LHKRFTVVDMLISQPLYQRIQTMNSTSPRYLLNSLLFI
jgi:hypothetical protein